MIGMRFTVNLSHYQIFIVSKDYILISLYMLDWIIAQISGRSSIFSHLEDALQKLSGETDDAYFVLRTQHGMADDDGR